jgi:hypothetical protein
LRRQVVKAPSGAEIRPDASRVERQQTATLQPTEVAEQVTTVASTKMRFLVSEVRRQELVNLVGL